MAPKKNKAAQPSRQSPEISEVTLRRGGQYLNIIPALDWLGEYLFTVRHAAVPDEQHGIRVVRVPYLLVWPQKDRQIGRFGQCYAGLEPMVQALLRRSGIPFRLTGDRLNGLPPPVTNEETLVDLPALEMVQFHDRGVIGYNPRKVRPASLIAQIALAWPKLKIVVTVTRLKDAREMRSELAELVGKVTLFTGNRNPARGTRVIVATYGSLGIGAIGIEKRHIYIALNPTELFAGFQSAPSEGIKHLRKARIYGLLADNAFIAPFQRSLMTALFGQEQVYIPKHGYHPLPVDVAFTRIVGGEPVPNHKEELVVKRLGIWRHHLRNRRIARLFKALVEQDRATLRGKYPDIVKSVPKMLGRVGILVENVEHALALAKLLPDVQLVTSEYVWKDGLDWPHFTKVRAAEHVEQPTKGHAIVTHAGLARAGRFRVLIRADAGTDMPELPRSWLAVRNGIDRRLLLIDCMDEHHAVLRIRSRVRKDAYRRNGWNVAGDAPCGPMDRFVAERPEVK